MKRVLILVEGQTEERFVKAVLAPYLHQLQIDMRPTIITTKRMLSGSDYKGGLRSFTQFERDLKLLFWDSSAVLVTTFIDYYHLPANFPGMEMAMFADPYKRVDHVEQMLRETFNNHRFLPFVMLHEFEAFCFVDPFLTAEFMDSTDKASELASAARLASGPEKIDQGSKTHPSYRIKSAFPSYDKVIDGVDIAELVGVEKLREGCPHFDHWLGQIVDLATA